MLSESHLAGLNFLEALRSGELARYFEREERAIYCGSNEPVPKEVPLRALIEVGLCYQFTINGHTVLVLSDLGRALCFGNDSQIKLES